MWQLWVFILASWTQRVECFFEDRLVLAIFCSESRCHRLQKETPQETCVVCVCARLLSASSIFTHFNHSNPGLDCCVLLLTENCGVVFTRIICQKSPPLTHACVFYSLFRCKPPGIICAFLVNTGNQPVLSLGAWASTFSRGRMTNII